MVSISYKRIKGCNTPTVFAACPVSTRVRSSEFFFDHRNVSFLTIPLFSWLSFVSKQLVPSLSDLLSITTYFHPRKLFSTVSEYHECYPLSLSLSFSHSISSILFASTPIDLFIHIPANFLLVEKLKERYTMHFVPTASQTFNDRHEWRKMSQRSSVIKNVSFLWCARIYQYRYFIYLASLHRNSLWPLLFVLFFRII